MKATSYLSGLAAILLLNSCGFLYGEPLFNRSPKNAIIGYQIGKQGANYRNWQKITQITDAQGSTTYQTNLAYVELAGGLNYWDGEQWRESKAEIDGYTGGAIAQYGQTKVIFANNLNTVGAIDLQTSDGKELRSHVLGLSYYDSSNGKNVLIAQVKDCRGQIAGSNQVVYANAFDGVSADVSYTYRRGSFEQDVILEAQPPAPEAFGLNPATTELQVLTEFDSAPAPAITGITNQSSSEMSDEILNFGAMSMVPGRAFLLNKHSSSARVSKQWAVISGRNILIESVQILDITNQLNDLPRTSMNSFKPKSGSGIYVVSSHRLLPAMRTAGNSVGEMKLARISPKTGFAFDYVTVVNQSDFTFQGGTYYVSGPVNLTGTTTFEGGAVIKYSAESINEPWDDAALVLNDPQLDDEASDYQPVIFTAKDDDSVGEHIDGSTGDPTGNYYANPALEVNSSTIPTPLSHFRIYYAAVGFYLSAYQIPGGITDDQLIDCEYPTEISCSSGETVPVHNVLMANCQTAFYNVFEANIDAENVTVAVCDTLWSIYTTSRPQSLTMVNCVLDQVHDLNNIYSEYGSYLTGSYNGFYYGLQFGYPTTVIRLSEVANVQTGCS
jgi:hypothetical protein